MASTHLENEARCYWQAARNLRLNLVSGDAAEEALDDLMLISEHTTNEHVRNGCDELVLASFREAKQCEC